MSGSRRRNAAEVRRAPTVADIAFAGEDQPGGNLRQDASAGPALPNHQQATKENAMVEPNPELMPDGAGDRPEIVTVCGSMRFFPRMLDCAGGETREGRIVLAPFVALSAPAQSEQAAFKAMLDELHRRKITMSDSVIVVTDETYYIGASTAAEIAYATSLGIEVLVFVYAGGSNSPVQIRVIEPNGPVWWRERLDCVLCCRRLDVDEQFLDCGDGPEHAACHDAFTDYAAGRVPS